MATSSGIRIDELRKNALTVRDGGALVLHDDFAAADAPADEASSAAGPPTFIQQFDLLHLLLDYTAGTDTDGVTITAEVAQYGSSQAEPEALWHDLYVLDPITGALTRWSATLSATADVNIAWSMPTYGAKWIRFTLWAPGANQTGARITLLGFGDKLSV